MAFVKPPFLKKFKKIAGTSNLTCLHIEQRFMVARAKAGRSHAQKSWSQSEKIWLRVQRLCNNWHEKRNFFRETLHYKDFDLRQAVRNGAERPRFPSVVNPRLVSTPCISTENKKIAVTVTLYQNNRDSVARLKGLEPLAHCLEGSCSIQLSYRRRYAIK